MTALLNWRVWAAVLVAVCLAASHWKAYKLGGSEARAILAQEREGLAKQSARVVEQTLAKQTDLQNKADAQRRNKDAQITRLNTDLAAALDGLRDRPPRPGPGDLPATTGPGPAAGCTGAQLYRPDAAFLTRIAGEADRLRIDLGQCQAAYESARQALTK